MAALIPVASFEVRIGGAALPAAAAADLTEVSVLEDVEAPSMFTLRLVNWDQEKIRVSWSDDKLFAEGGEVEVRMGYVGKLETLIAGEITGLEPEFDADRVPMLTVRGYDRGHRLLRGRKTRTFLDQSDSEIAAQVVREAGLSAKVKNTGVKRPYVAQHNQTDMEFLREIAGRNGYEVVVEAKDLHFRPHRNGERPTLKLARTADLLRFSPRLSTVALAGGVEVRGWDPKSKKAVVAKAKPGDELARMDGDATGPKVADQRFGPAVAASVERPVSAQAEAEAVARGRFREMGLSFVTGDGLCIGRTDLRAGRVADVDGLGKRFSGSYYVTSTVHSYAPGRGYRTAFRFRRNAT